MPQRRHTDRGSTLITISLKRKTALKTLNAGKSSRPTAQKVRANSSGAHFVQKHHQNRFQPLTVSL